MSVKGIYNENEFYTFNYWENKLAERIKAEADRVTDLESKIKEMRQLDKDFWKLKEKQQVEQLKNFNTNFLQLLDYNVQASNFRTQQDNFITEYVDLEGLKCFYVNADDKGDFEQPAYHEVKENETVDNRNLGEIIDEELDGNHAPEWILVCATNALFVLQKNKWKFGRYLRIEWQEIFVQIEKESYRFILTLFSKQALSPQDSNALHRQLDEENHRHACAVSTDLRDGAKQSIELLVNEFIHYKAHQKYLATTDNQQYARDLTHDALYYVYRLIFLLYLEARPEESVLLPLKSPIYKQGYSIDKLLEKILYPMEEGDLDYNGYFFDESLKKIFTLVFHGFKPQANTGFVAHRLQSSLFNPDKIKYLDTAKIRNGKWQQILQALTLNKPKKQKRGRVSYASLGINQLGAVYEDLLSYTGFFADTDLYHLKSAKIKPKDVDKDNIYLASQKIVDKYSSNKVNYRLTADNFVVDEEGKKSIYQKGSFIYRLAGKDRSLSASYYTPEALTKCVVKYALNAVYEDKTHLDDLWQIKILEPAMGSGAFLIEAVNQLAEKIFSLEKPNNGITANDKNKRLYAIRHQLIADNVYGVDLNPTAVELACFSLWLNCINSGKPPPQLNNLKVGNSLTGGWLQKQDGIYNWLLLDKNWGQYGNQLKTYSIDTHRELKNFGNRLYKTRLKNNNPLLTNLQKRVEDTVVNFKKDYQTGQQELSRCFDLWCSAFFVNLEALAFFPTTHEDYLICIEKILSRQPLDQRLQKFITHTTDQQKFFHWQLEYPQIMFDSGGFDLILGNPPWVKVQWEDLAQLSDYHPIPAVRNLNATSTRKFVQEQLDQSTKQRLVRESINIDGCSKLLDSDNYAILQKINKNSYKSFTVRALSLLSPMGVSGFLHPDGLLEDDKATAIRTDLYQKMRYHFQFVNSLKLFTEIDGRVNFSINILQNKSNQVNFDHIGNLCDPKTIEACYTDQRSPSGQPVPLVKDEQGKLETRGHRQRIITISDRQLELFSRFLNSDSSAPPFLNLHSKNLFSFVQKIAAVNLKVGQWLGGEDNYRGSRMFDETGDQDKGNIVDNNCYPANIEHLVLSGPHIDTGNPLFQETQETYSSKFSYNKLDLENISDDFIQRARYQLAVSADKADKSLPKFNDQPFRSFYRIATRSYVNRSNERCMFACIIPKGVSHVHKIVSFATNSNSKLLAIGGLTSSIVIDGMHRLTNIISFFETDFAKLPVPKNKKYLASIARRFLSLNGLTVYYDQLWRSVVKLDRRDRLVTGRKLFGYGQPYQRRAALRIPAERQQALLEIDVLTALSFELTVEELRQVYEILFPVMAKYDRNNGYDRKYKIRQAYKFFLERGW